MYDQEENPYPEWDSFNDTNRDWDDYDDPSEPNGGGGCKRGWYFVVFLVVIVFLAGGFFLLRRGEPTMPRSESIPNAPTADGGQATAVPLIDTKMAERQMQVAVSSHTSRQTLGLDCVAGTCNQRVVFDLIFLDEDMLRAIATQELIGRQVTEVEPRVENLRRRLNSDEQIPFLLISRVGHRTVPARQGLQIGPAEHRLSLHNVRHETYAPVDWDDHLFDRPMRLQPETKNQGYLFFDRLDPSGTIAVDLQNDRSFRVEMHVDDSVNPDPSTLIWYFPLLSTGTSNQPIDNEYPEEDIPLEDILEIIGVLVQVAALL